VRHVTSVSEPWKKKSSQFNGGHWVDVFFWARTLTVDEFSINKDGATVGDKKIDTQEVTIMRIE
jgi:hypothetical protein